MSDDDLYDKYEQKRSSAGIPELIDPSQREDTDRPLRTEDLIPRHGSHGTPKIWLPDGKKMEYYARPSGWGEGADNSDRLKAWEVRTTVEGYFDTGQQGKTLQLERSILPPPAEDKGGHDKVNQKAKNLVFDADRQGTAKHKMTEKYDLAIPFHVAEGYEPVIEAWANLTRYFRIVDLPNGKPGIECFVAMDAQRLDQYGEPMTDRDGNPIMVRAAGTFDRFVRYIPCRICGCSNYILDLKTSSANGLSFAQRKTGIQLGIYVNAALYEPWPDGKGADRYELPDVCKHRGIVVSIPPDGEPKVIWTNVARGFFRAVSLIPAIKDHQKEQDWTEEFTPVPNVWAMIDAAQTRQEVQALQHTHPGEQWTENDGALGKYASAKVASLSGKVLS